MNPWTKETGEKYLHGWDRRATIVLLGASVLLTLYRFIGRRRVFTQLFGKFFIQSAQKDFSVLLLVLDDRTNIVTAAGPCGQICMEIRGFRLNGKLGWGFVLGSWLLNCPSLTILPCFPAEISAFQRCWD